MSSCLSAKKFHGSAAPYSYRAQYGVVLSKRRLMSKRFADVVHRDQVIK